MRRLLVFSLLMSLMLGCGSGEETTATADPPPESSGDVAETASGNQSNSAPKKKRTLTPLDLGGIDHNVAAETAGAATSSEDRLNSIIDQLKPLQVLLGSWRGTTRREFDGFKAVDLHEWVWDLQSEPDQPSLVMSSGGKSPYIGEARLTWRTESSDYLLTLISPEDKKRVFVGEFSKPVEDVAGDDGKLQRTFALTFTQTEPADAKEQFQYTFNQQENNRYLMEISKKRGKAAFRRFDTVSTQRDGTSFALSDSDYGEKTCIISAGLGTISVSYKGQTYWVCCSGCKAAFEEEPER
ncbi:MAG: hypothetical protein AB8G99_00815, partial [Planctomycetaceae bacterium]